MADSPDTLCSCPLATGVVPGTLSRSSVTHSQYFEYFSLCLSILMTVASAGRVPSRKWRPSPSLHFHGVVPVRSVVWLSLSTSSLIVLRLRAAVCHVARVVSAVAGLAGCPASLRR
eukprot:4054522-Prymnesium_polylepis.2